MVLISRALSLCFLLTAGLLSSCSRPHEEAVEALPSPAGAASSAPHLAQGPDGTVVLSWLEIDGNGAALRYSALANDAWTEAQTVARGEDWFVNWADFPSVVPLYETLWAAHWLLKRPGGTYSYDVAVSLSRDSGQSWSAPITPHTDGTRTEHGFVSLFPWHGGVGALWLDGRNMAADEHGSAGEMGGGMTLRTAVVTAEGELAHEQRLDELVCDCCQTDIALTSSGAVAVYRNRTAAEIRDIHVARHVDGAWRHGRPIADDGWEINGCPVNGPAVAAEGDVVGVAWFTAADGVPRVRVSRSTDGAATFSPSIDVASESALGRVDVALLDDGALAVSWLRRGDASDGELCARRVAPDGTLGPVRVIARVATNRPTGFPQMVRHGDDLLFAWTDITANTVKTARLALRADPSL